MKYLDLMFKLLISGADGAKLKKYQDFAYKKRKMCEYLASQIRMMKHEDGEFDFITDFKNNELIIYSKFGITFVPKCVQVDAILIKNESDCKDGVPVEYMLDNTNKMAMIDSKIILIDVEKR